MKTLAEILSGETSTAVIFAHVHRRQRELKQRLLIDGAWTFDMASDVDLKDYLFLHTFREYLTNEWTFITGEQNLANSRVVRAAKSELNARSVFCRTLEHSAISLAHTVIYAGNLHENDPVYEAINPTECRIAAA